MQPRSHIKYLTETSNLFIKVIKVTFKIFLAYDVTYIRKEKVRKEEK